MFQDIHLHSMSLLLVRSMWCGNEREEEGLRRPYHLSQYVHLVLFDEDIHIRIWLKDSLCLLHVLICMSIRGV